MEYHSPKEDIEEIGKETNGCNLQELPEILRTTQSRQKNQESLPAHPSYQKRPVCRLKPTLLGIQQESNIVVGEGWQDKSSHPPRSKAIQLVGLQVRYNVVSSNRLMMK